MNRSILSIKIKQKLNMKKLRNIKQKLQKRLKIINYEI